MHLESLFCKLLAKKRRAVGVEDSSKQDKRISQPKQKGEGWLPFLGNSLTNAIFFHDECDEDAPSLYEEPVCSQGSIDATSEKLEVTSYSNGYEESLGPPLFDIGDELEMGDASNPQLPTYDDLEIVDPSNPTWKDSEGQEMFNSSHPRVVDSTESWDNPSSSVKEFSKGWVITWLALQSLSLSNMAVEGIQGDSTNPLLPTHSKNGFLAFGSGVLQERPGKQEWQNIEKVEGWETIMCYNVAFSEEDLSQEQTNKGEEKEEDFWEAKRISDKPEIALFLQNIKDEENEVSDPDDGPEDNLSQNSWELPNQGRPQALFVFFNNNVDLPWKEDIMAEPFAYEDSFDAEEDEYHWWTFTMFRGDRNEEEDVDQAIFFLQEIERVLQNRIWGLERLLVSGRHLYHEQSKHLESNPDTDRKSVV